MKNKFTSLLLCFVTFCACMHAATLTHRYDFNKNAKDSIGSLDGVLSIDDPYGHTTGYSTEAPHFTNVIPDNARTHFAEKSIKFGMNLDNLDSYKISSFINFGSGTQTEIFKGKAGSFSYWFKADRLLGSRDLVSNISDSGVLRTRLMKIDADGGYFTLALKGGGKEKIFDKTENPFEKGKWHHLVVAWDDRKDQEDKKLKIALDGVSKIALLDKDGNTQLSDPGRLMVGNYNSGSHPGTQFVGSIFDLQIYDDYLDKAEIESLYNNPGASLSEVPEPRNYSLLISLLVLRHMQARRRRPAN